MRTHLGTATLRSDTRAIAIEGKPAELFEFLADPANLPLWAVGFCRGIRRDGDRWVVSTATGDVGIRYVTDRELGVIDFYMSPAPGVEVAAFSRVLPSGEGSEYVFTQFQSAGMPDEVFDRQVTALEEELHILRGIVRARAACATIGAADQDVDAKS